MTDLWKLRYGQSQMEIFEVIGNKRTIELLYHNLHTNLKDNSFDFQYSVEEYRYCPLNIFEVKEITEDEELTEDEESIFFETEDI